MIPTPLKLLITKFDWPSVWDLGANKGLFSRLASQIGVTTIAFDSDPSVVEACYLAAQQEGGASLLPLVIDLATPSPPIGWANQEGMGLAQRGPADMVLALALIHHLAIANNEPLKMIAEYFRSLSHWAVVELVQGLLQPVQPKPEQTQRWCFFWKLGKAPSRPTLRNGSSTNLAPCSTWNKPPVEGSERVLCLLRGRQKTR